jgi:U11/U12 small nuclear ribonucleoprotein SNRNP35
MTRENDDDKYQYSNKLEQRKEVAVSRKRTRGNGHDYSNKNPLGNRIWYAKEYDPIRIGSIDGTDSVPHDKALLRAMNAKFDASKDPQIVGDPYKTLYVARLNYDTTEETIHQVFSQYGTIRHLRLVRDIVTQKSKGYAFIEYEYERDFVVAYERANKKVIDGHSVLVEFERGRVMKGWKPRRLGGGLGGKKESGQLRFGGRDRPFKRPFQ